MDIISKIKEAQSVGCCICPRCGRWMELPIPRNALSRVADVYICPDCGMDEALRALGRIPLPVEEWEILKLWRDQNR